MPPATGRTYLFSLNSFVSIISLRPILALFQFFIEMPIVYCFSPIPTISTGEAMCTSRSILRFWNVFTLIPKSGTTSKRTAKGVILISVIVPPALKAVSVLDNSSAIALTYSGSVKLFFVL